jgi:alkanesulfonate monooxygenase SsuD/methylene tetrahydromethanopterin reductase-like flavin-dependent oxidoreductase (luciferase family)
VVPASAQPAAFYAEQARRVWEASGGAFVLGVGSGRLAHPATEMRPYLTELRRLLPSALPLYVAALGPRMLGLAAELADGVLLNWCSAEQVRWSRAEVERAAVRFGRGAPVIAEYIRTAVDSDPDRARGVLARATEGYALGPSPYRRHFERMGFAEELRRHPSTGAELSPELLSAVPGEFRGRSGTRCCGWLRDWTSPSSGCWSRPPEMRPRRGWPWRSASLPDAELLAEAALRRVAQRTF